MSWEDEIDDYASELEQEVIDLKAENERLKARIAELEVELDVCNDAHMEGY